MTSTKPLPMVVASAAAVLTLQLGPVPALATTSPSAPPGHGSHQHGADHSVSSPTGRPEHAGHDSHGSHGTDGYGSHATDTHDSHGTESHAHDGGGGADSKTDHTDHGGAADTVSSRSRAYVLSGFGAVNVAVLGAALAMRRRVAGPARGRGSR